MGWSTLLSVVEKLLLRRGRCFVWVPPDLCEVPSILERSPPSGVAPDYQQLQDCYMTQRGSSHLQYSMNAFSITLKHCNFVLDLFWIPHDDDDDGVEAACMALLFGE